MARIIEFIPGRFKVENEIVTKYTHQLHVNEDSVGVWNVGNGRYVDGQERHFNEWLDKDGNNYTSLENLINDLDTFFFQDSDVGSGLVTNYRASNFDDIANVAPNPQINETVFVEYGQGVYFFNRKPGQSIYIWNGSVWTNDLEEVITRLGVTTDTVNSMILVNSNQDTAIAQNASNITTETNNRVSGDEGSVTIHNDVNNAGSGEIITSQERQDINASIGVHSDVDLSGVSIINNSVLRWNGSNFIPCLNQVILSSSLQINNSNVFTEKLGVDINIQRIAQHKIKVDYNWSVNDGGQDLRTLINFADSRIQNVLTESDVHRQEPKDTAGISLDGRGTNQIYSFSKTFIVNPTSVGNNNLSLQFAGSENGNLASIWGVVVEIEELVEVIGS